MKKSVHPRFIYVSKKLILFYWLHIGSSENCFGVLRGFSDSGIHHNGTACHRAGPYAIFYAYQWQWYINLALP
jgi:hypothetical protein